VQRHWLGLERRFGACAGTSSVWSRSSERRHGSHPRELHLRRETALLLVPERAKQRTCARSIESSGASLRLIPSFIPSGRVRCSRGHTLRPSTWTCTTSKTDHRTTSSWTRTLPSLLPARPRRKSPLRSITQSRNRHRRRGRSGSPLRGLRENRAC
jgi:hypothetical protein